MLTLDNDKKLMKKYHDVMGAVGEAYSNGIYEMSIEIALEVMKSAVRNATTDSVMGIPEGFDWKAFAADMVECVE